MNDKALHSPQDPEQEEAKAQETPSPAWPSPGQKLQKIREEMGLSHGRVADALHLTAHYVRALENDQFDKLPGKTFVRGYYRAYARLLGVNVEEVLQCYERFVEALEETEKCEAKVIKAKKTYDQNMRWMVCAAAIIVVVVGVSWWLAREGEPEAEMVQAQGVPAGQPDVGPGDAITAEVLVAAQDDTVETADGGQEPGEDTLAAEAAPAETLAETLEEPGVAAAEADLEPVVATAQANQAGLAGGEEVISDLPEYTVTEMDNNRMVQLESVGNDLLEVHFTGASWIEVDNGDNTRLYNDMLETGDDLTIKGKAPFNILIGDASVVDVTFNSRAVDVTSQMRNDNSARIVLEPETR